MSVIVRVRKPDSFEVVLEIKDRVFGTAANVAKRLRADGFKARQKGLEVVVDAE